MKKALIILGKEWRELRSERTLVFSTLLPPLLFAILPVLIAFAAGQTPDEDMGELGAVLADPALAGLSSLELGQAIIGRQFGLLMLLTPLIVPSVIASYSIVGEKTRRTLEPLLATPIHSWELLLGKSLTALIPTLIVTWIGAALFVGGMALVAVSSAVMRAIISPGWLTTLLLCTGPLALIMIAACVAISARVNDPRTAQQVSAIAVVPLLALFFAQLIGVIVLSAAFALAMATILTVIAVLAVWAAAGIFQREHILTRWG